MLIDKYNKIVQRVNKEISATHINEDMSQLMTCFLKQDEECIKYVQSSGNTIFDSMLQVSQYTFNFQGIYLMSQHQMSKQQLQYFIKFLLNLKNIEFDDSGMGYIVWDLLMNLEKSYQNVCVCSYEEGSSSEVKYKPCNKLDSVGHAVDMLFEEGHYCVLNSDNNTIFSDKTIKMMKKFVEL